MPSYNYKARDKFGKLTSGKMTVDSEAIVADRLKQMGYVPTSINKEELRAWVEKFDIFRRVKFSELNIFTRQFYTLQKAGLPIISTLNTLREETTSRLLNNAVAEIIKDIEGGASLSIALAKHPKVFNELYVNMVKAGETSGKLDATLEKLAALGESDERIRLRIKSATRYPVIVIVTMIVAFLILTTLVMPRFAKLYGQFKTALPLPTQILLWINYAVTKFWWLILIILGVFIFIFRRFIKTEKGRFWWDGLKLKVPIFGPIVLKLIVSRFTRITGILMGEGIPILHILELVGSGAGNVVIGKTIDNIRQCVSEGKGMAEPIKKSGIFPPVVIQMVKVGEETGKMEELLLYVSDYYESQVDYVLNNLITLIEPIMIFTLGFAVLFMALGVFLPIWNMMSLFRK